MSVDLTEVLLDCPTCEGTGYSVIATMHVAGEDCEDCSGSGRVAAECDGCPAGCEECIDDDRIAEERLEARDRAAWRNL